MCVFSLFFFFLNFYFLCKDKKCFTKKKINVSSVCNLALKLKYTILINSLY